MHTAKIQTERKMRADLDAKILSMPIEKLQRGLGIALAEKARIYAKQYKQLISDKMDTLDTFQDYSDSSYESDGIISDVVPLKPVR